MQNRSANRPADTEPIHANRLRRWRERLGTAEHSYVLWFYPRGGEHDDRERRGVFVTLDKAVAASDFPDSACWDQCTSDAWNLDDPIIEAAGLQYSWWSIEREPRRKPIAAAIAWRAMTNSKKLLARPLAEAIYYADLVVAGAAAATSGAVAWRVLNLPPVTVAVSTLVVAAGAFGLAQLFPARLLGKGWMAVHAWADRKPNPPATQLTPRPTAIHPVVEPTSRSTDPRPLATCELTSWTCPWCESTASTGTHRWDDRGPYQLLSVHTLECPGGHRWTNSTDGG
ncbi:hypothetical protein [Streptomyces mirabilis]|uniref:hypothetical protein n=1 Tax=Streptomyces mirabilis TaxID=68239 RepID=UPI0033CA879F